MYIFYFINKLVSYYNLTTYYGLWTYLLFLNLKFSINDFFFVPRATICDSSIIYLNYYVDYFQFYNSDYIGL